VDANLTYAPRDTDPTTIDDSKWRTWRVVARKKGTETKDLLVIFCGGIPPTTQVQVFAYNVIISVYSNQGF